MNESERTELGKRVAGARTKRGWSKEKLAEEAAINTTTLRRIEGGLRVQDAKLSLVLNTLGLGRDLDEEPDRYSEDQMHPMVFVLPPEIENGYHETARFADAVGRHVPELAPLATDLMLQAAGLFSSAGKAILAKGGDGDAEGYRSAAPTNGPGSGPDELAGRRGRSLADEPARAVAAGGSDPDLAEQASAQAAASKAKQLEAMREMEEKKRRREQDKGSGPVK